MQVLRLAVTTGGQTVDGETQSQSKAWCLEHGEHGFKLVTKVTAPLSKITIKKICQYVSS